MIAFGDDRAAKDGLARKAKNARVRVELRFNSAPWVFAFNEFAVQEDGSVMLIPEHLARFYSDSIGRSSSPAIYLTFDRKVRSIAEMRRAIITGARSPRDVVVYPWLTMKPLTIDKR